jgi:hypothetical protein
MIAEPKTSIEWRGVIANLEAKRADIESKIGARDTERQPFTLAAALGDEKARAQLAGMSAEETALWREALDLDAAITEAKAMLGDALKRESAEENRRRAAKARKLAGDRREQAAKIDKLLGSLARAFDELDRIGDAARTALGGLDHSTSVRATSPSRAAAAVYHHGLGERIGVERQRAMPFVEADEGFTARVLMAADALDNRLEEGAR